jgi:hypothetical protein
MRDRTGFLGGSPAAQEGPEVFLQWKGTDACFDFNCSCGWSGHFDGDFAYLVKCGGCQQVWEMPCLLYPRKSEREGSMKPVVPLK